jgi:hypothetical protein
MLIQQGLRPAHTIVFEGALGFVTAEPRAILVRLLGGSIACDAFPMPVEIDEIAQCRLHQPTWAKREAPLSEKREAPRYKTRASPSPRMRGALSFRA